MPNNTNDSNVFTGSKANKNMSMHYIKGHNWTNGDDDGNSEKMSAETDFQPVSVVIAYKRNSAQKIDTGHHLKMALL